MAGFWFRGSRRSHVGNCRSKSCRSWNNNSVNQQQWHCDHGHLCRINRRQHGHGNKRPRIPNQLCRWRWQRRTAHRVDVDIRLRPDFRFGCRKRFWRCCDRHRQSIGRHFNSGFGDGQRIIGVSESGHRLQFHQCLHGFFCCGTIISHDFHRHHR